MNYKFRNKNGITLIVLVVTIIVLLILAGISIVMLYGDNGILRKVIKAKVETEKANELENLQLAVTAVLSEENGIISAIKLQEELKENNIVQLDNCIKYNAKYYMYKISFSGKIDKISRTKMNKSKFKTFTQENTPSQIIFTNSGKKDKSTDIGDDSGEIFAWMEDKIMYVSTKEAYCLVDSPIDCSELFYSGTRDGWQSNLTLIDLEFFDTSECNNMSNMFYLCTTLANINLATLDTSNTNTMYAMFRDCQNIVNLDLKNFNTKKVMTFDWMFCNCFKLKNINLTSFDTSNATTLRRMFYDCAELTEIDISSFDTKNVIEISDMFHANKLVEKIYVSSKWSTANIVRDINTFFWCYKLPNYSEYYKISPNYAINGLNHAFVGNEGYFTLKE